MPQTGFQGAHNFQSRDIHLNNHEQHGPAVFNSNTYQDQASHAQAFGAKGAPATVYMGTPSRHPSPSGNREGERSGHSRAHRSSPSPNRPSRETPPPPTVPRSHSARGSPSSHSPAGRSKSRLPSDQSGAHPPRSQTYPEPALRRSTPSKSLTAPAFQSPTWNELHYYNQGALSRYAPPPVPKGYLEIESTPNANCHFALPISVYQGEAKASKAGQLQCNIQGEAMIRFVLC